MTAVEEQCQRELEEQRAALATFLQRQTANAPANGFSAPDEQALVRWMSNRLESIDYALERLTNNEFGICQQCNQQISPDRLNALPDAKLCIKCQQQTPLRVCRRAPYTMPGKAYQRGATCMMPS